MSRVALNFLGLLAAIAAAVYQFYVKDFLILLGHNRVVESLGNVNCRKIPELRACESQFASKLIAVYGFPIETLPQRSSFTSHLAIATSRAQSLNVVSSGFLLPSALMPVERQTTILQYTILKHPKSQNSSLMAMTIPVDIPRMEWMLSHLNQTLLNSFCT